MSRPKPLLAVAPLSANREEQRSVEPDIETVSKEKALADQQLAARCLAGEVAAWEELYAQCHEPLLSSIRTMWNGYAVDSHFVDEIAARVWYKLVADDGAALARYDPNRGRLITFMRAMAKDVARHEFRTERRRRVREATSLRQKMRRVFDNPDEATKSINEFLTTLTAEEQVFCRDFLMDSPGDGEESEHGATSPRSLFRWTGRIYEKLLRFLDRA